MELLVSTVILIAVAVLGIVLHRLIFNRLAINYVDLALGMLIGAIPFFNHFIVQFHSEIFMTSIVAPLLFFDGTDMRFNRVAKNFRVIISLTILMALACAVVAGFGMAATRLVSLPVAFVLAAISTPTDATASEAVSYDLVMPKKEGLYLKLESLFNDASGIILLNMAVLWYANGYINYGQTLTNFVYSAIGGALTGFVLGGTLIFLRQTLIRSNLNFARQGNDAGVPSKVVYLATPFIIYLLSEHIHVSGIIAVVCAGVLHNVEQERSNLLNPRLIYDTNSLVDMFKQILNGVVFVELGLMMIRIMESNSSFFHRTSWIILGVIMYVANVLVRFLYSWWVSHMTPHEALIFALGGVHGTVTFALAFMVADTAVQRADFNLVVMAEAVLIVLSLLVPTILFRWLLKPQPKNKVVHQKIIAIREAMIQHAIDRINKIYLPDELRQIILYDLQTQMRDTSFRHFWAAFRRSLRQPALNDSEINTLDIAYRLAFHEEREYLGEVSQQEMDNMEVITHLYSEILMAEMVVLNHH